MTEKSKESLAKEQAKTATQTARDGALNTGIAAPSTSDVQKARNEGVTEAIKENAKDAYNYATDGQLPGEPANQRFLGSDQHSNMIDGMLSMSPQALEEAVAEKADVPLSEDQVANLLKLERAGQNRTPYVHLLCKRLKVKSPYEVTNAGPAYTNAVNTVDLI